MKRLFIILSFLGLSFLILNCGGDVVNKLTFVEPKINKDSLLKLGVPERITNQYILVRKSVKYVNKSFFIVDTKENLIYCFDKDGTFVAKSPTIDGFDKQNPKKVTDALKSWSEHVNHIGFKWDNSKNKYVDTTGKNRIYSHKLVYDHLGEVKCRFFPKGVYKITHKYHYDGFIGDGDNTYNVRTINGNKDLSLAIHGLYNSQYRIQNMNNLVSLIGSDYTSVKVSKTFKNTISINNNNGVYNNSYGCVNIPKKFLKLTNHIAVNSLVFVLGESQNDYIVQ